MEYFLIGFVYVMIASYFKPIVYRYFWKSLKLVDRTFIWPAFITIMLWPAGLPALLLTESFEEYYSRLKSV